MRDTSKKAGQVRRTLQLHHTISNPVQQAPIIREALDDAEGNARYSRGDKLYHPQRVTDTNHQPTSKYWPNGDKR